MYASQTPYKKELKINQVVNLKNNLKQILSLLQKEEPEAHKKLEQLVKDEGNTTEVFNTTLSIFIGKKLSRHASIALKAMTALAYREYNYCNITSLGSKTEVNSSDFWDLCNVKKGSSGYDTRGKNLIKDAIYGELCEKIFYEDKASFFITHFVASFDHSCKKKNKCIFQIDDMFLVPEGVEDYSYYYSDLEGCNRLMDKTKYKDKAYWLHHYLEHCIKKGEQEFNIKTLIEHVGLTNLFFTKREKTKATKILDTILDEMISANTLIYKRERLVSNSDPDGKYILSNLRLKDRIVSIKRRKSSKKQS